MTPSPFFLFTDMLRGVSLFDKLTNKEIAKFEAFAANQSAWLQTAKQILDGTHPKIGCRQKTSILRNFIPATN